MEKRDTYRPAISLTISTNYYYRELPRHIMVIGMPDIQSHLPVVLVIFLIFISMLSTNVITYCHLYGNGVQQWVNKEEDIKIQFKYTLYKPEIHNYHQLNFSIQDLTGKHVKGLTASITITNDPLFAFDNITIPNGDFAVVCPFLDNGQHQVIVNVRTGNNALALASFNMTIPWSNSTSS
jgi:hypothetical protein